MKENYAKSKPVTKWNNWQQWRVCGPQFHKLEIRSIDKNWPSRSHLITKEIVPPSTLPSKPRNDLGFCWEKRPIAIFSGPRELVNGRQNKSTPNNYENRPALIPITVFKRNQVRGREAKNMVHSPLRLLMNIFPNGHYINTGKRKRLDEGRRTMKCTHSVSSWFFSSAILLLFSILKRQLFCPAI